jgi:tripartite ATP-independent transporter DctP family solute receptor
MKALTWCQVLFGVALVCALLLWPQPSPSVQAQTKTVIRVGSPYQTGHILVEAATKFKELVAQESGGRIEVQVQAGTASEEEINEWCSAGKIEMQANGTMFLQTFAPQYYFFSGPYVMKDFEHFMRVWEGRLGQAARAQLEQKGNLKFLGTVYRGLRQMTAKKPIYTPADVGGLKLRLPQNPAWIAVWREMGAVPVPVILPELYQSLQDGRAESAEGDLSQIVSSKLYEVQSHLVITNHLVQVSGILINKQFHESLPAADQALIVKAAQEASDWANNKTKTGELGLLVELQRKGMHVVIPNADSFREKGKPAVEALFKQEWPVTTWNEVLAQ